MRSRGLFVALFVWLTVANAAADPDLDRARREFANLEVERAEASLAASLASGANTRSELIDAYMLGGQIAVVLGKQSVALERFKRALALDPTRKLTGVAPKIAAPFARAQAFYKTRKPLTVEQSIVTQPERQVVLNVIADPLSMVAEARVVDAKTGHAIRVSGGTELRVPVPGIQRREVIASLHDRQGNELAVFGSAATPLVLPGTPLGSAVRGADTTLAGGELSLVGTQGPQRTQRSLLARWPVWAGATAVFAGTGIYFGLRTRAAERDFDVLKRADPPPTFAAARDAGDRIDRNALLTNISFGVAAATGVVGVIMFVRGRRTAETPSAPTAQLGATPVSGGALATLGLTF